MARSTLGVDPVGRRPEHIAGSAELLYIVRIERDGFVASWVGASTECDRADQVLQRKHQDEDEDEDPGHSNADHQR